MAAHRVVVGPREALRTSALRLRDVNWIGDGTLEQALAGQARALASAPAGEGCGQGREIFVKVRSTRAPQPAWLFRGAGGVEVELIAGEDGVSPGQACVFYDAPSGQARVLGGGIIQSAMAAGAALPGRRAAAVSGRAAARG
jgi:tRNA-specific 2-thiouridylase